MPIPYIGKINISSNTPVRLLEVVLLSGVVLLALQILHGFDNHPNNEMRKDRIVQHENVAKQDWSKNIATPPAVVKALFGLPGDEIESDKVAEPVRETGLDLVLKGILLQKGTDRRLAVIQHANKEEKVYRVGDGIENARVVEIETRRVVLRHRGVNESLSLRVDKLARHEEQVSTQGSRVTGDIKMEFKVEREEFHSRLNDLPSLLKTARTEPYSENDQPAGFRIVDVQKDSVFRQLGLKRDDVLRSVNGLDVNNTKDAFWAYRKLRKEDNFQLAILRDGREVTINYSIQ